MEKIRAGIHRRRAPFHPAKLLLVCRGKKSARHVRQVKSAARWAKLLAGRNTRPERISGTKASRLASPAPSGESRRTRPQFFRRIEIPARINPATFAADRGLLLSDAAPRKQSPGAPSGRRAGEGQAAGRAMDRRGGAGSGTREAANKHRPQHESLPSISKTQ